MLIRRLLLSFLFVGMVGQLYGRNFERSSTVELSADAQEHNSRILRSLDDIRQSVQRIAIISLLEVIYPEKHSLKEKMLDKVQNKI